MSEILFEKQLTCPPPPAVQLDVSILVIKTQTLLSKATYSERHNQATMRSRPKYYLTVLNHLVQVLLATNSAELWSGSEEGHEQEKRVGEMRKVKP